MGFGNRWFWNQGAKVVMRVYIANDHGGVDLKLEIIKRFSDEYSFINLGTDTKDIVRYPYYAEKVAKSVLNDSDSLGILICSTGIGMSIAANKFRGIRASLCTDSYMARMTRQHNNSNVLCLGGQVIGILDALDIVGTWLSSNFIGGRHSISISLIDEIEKNLISKTPEKSVMTEGR